MNYAGVCRTAPATLGLLKSVIKNIKQFNVFIENMKRKEDDKSEIKI